MTAKPAVQERRSQHPAAWVGLGSGPLDCCFSLPIGEAGLMEQYRVQALQSVSTQPHQFRLLLGINGTHTPREVQGRGGRPSELGKQLWWQLNRNGKVSGKLTAAQGGVWGPTKPIS